MADQGSVTVIRENGKIGAIVASADGTIGIIMTGATEGTVTAGTPFLVTNEAEITALGLTTGNNALAVKFFNEFLAECALFNVTTFALYVQLMSSATKINSMCDVTNANGLKKLVLFGNGAIRYVGALSNDTLVYPGGTGLTVTGGINADCYTAITNMQALLNSFAGSDYNWHMQGAVGCTNFTGTASSLTDISANATNRVKGFIGDTASGTGCALGIVLARKACFPVQRKISRKRSGPISSATAFIGTASADAYASISTIASKGFNTWRQYTGSNGFYFTNDTTACPNTDDYHVQPRGSVADKVARIAVAIYTEDIDDDVDTNDDGTIDAGVAKSYEAAVENDIKVSMAAKGELKAVDVNVDPTQNVDATEEVDIAIEIKGKGYTQTFNVSVGYKAAS